LPKWIDMTDQIGRYEIRGELGSGGQGTVYLGFDPKTRRKVTIKVLRFDPPSSARNRVVFETAKRLRAITHPGVVPIIDSGEMGSDAYFVYESVAEGDLGRLLRQGGALSAAKALGILRPILDAVAALHRAEYFNCDLKPSNILLDAAGVPRLVDLGVASRLSLAGSSSLSFSGTPAYLAPEFIDQRHFGPAADVYAAGLVLFEMLTGRPAVCGDSVGEMLQRIREEDVRLPEDTRVDERLAAIIHKAVARDPVLRFHDIKQFAKALDEYLAPEESSATEVARGETTLAFLLRRMRHKNDFPALSESVAAINRIASSETERADKLSNVILKDFALTNQLVRLVNSAYYRPAVGGTISTVSRAVAVLGFETTRNIAISVLLLEHMQNKSISRQLKEDFIRVNLAGLLARKLATDTRQQDLEQVFICAMFHGLGRLLAHFYFPEESAEVPGVMTRKQCGEEAASRQVFGISFEDLGLAVAERWGFPPVILNAMKKLPPGPVPSVNTLEDRLRVFAAFANEVCDTIAQTPAEHLQATIAGVEERLGPVIGLKPNGLRKVMESALTEVGGYCRVARIDLTKTDLGKQVNRYLHPGPVAAEAADGEAAGSGGELSNPLDVATDESVEAAHDPSSILAAGMQEISMTLVEDFRLNDILRTILETMFRAIGFRRVLLCTREVKTGLMQARYGFGVDAADVAKRFKFELAARPDVFCAATDKGIDILIRDINDPLIAARIPEWYRKTVPARSMLLLPINVKGKPVALIYADRDEADGIRIPEQELALLRTLRNQAILAIKLGKT
jgi:serine/threonine protein kinase